MRVFTNGCFDLLHPGHLSLLSYCSNLGSVIVGLNSDSSVRKLKGTSRPVMSEQERMMALQSCRFVDEVHVFPEETPYRLISELQPDVIVKGAEFRGGPVVGDDIAPIRFFDGVWDISTTTVIDRVMRLAR